MPTRRRKPKVAKPLTGKDMRPDWYDELSPEEKADWDETEYDPDILGSANLAILGGGPPKKAAAKKLPAR